ncbi:hypothetical protein BSKO_07456 [Bryopsis sp. KO-2023]|nr:hypothetical protein BSKO_07456 [Bryopsis sp. KO-2023]
MVSATAIGEKDPDGQPASKSVFTFAEVSKHNQADDCWMVVSGKVYDVTKFVPRHPGGNMIYVNAGKDATNLFDSYHPPGAREVLKKFYIGELQKEDEIQAFRADFGENDQDRIFYDTIKKRVNEMFKKSKIDPRFSWQMYIKTAIILSACALSVYGSFYVSFSNLLASAVCAVCLGFFSASVGVAVQHDANHGAYSNSPTLNKCVGWLLDAVGASSFLWKQQHVVGHHVYTNVDGLDPDIRVKDPDVRRVTDRQPWRSYQVYQHLYLGVLYGVLSIKSILLDDFSALSSNKIGAVPLTRLTQEEKIVFWSGKVFWFAYYVLFPVTFTPHSFGKLLLIWTIAQLVAGWTLAFMFQVNHVTDDVVFFKGDDTGTISRGWAMSQVEGTSDFAHDSWLWMHVSGGLNFQVVHHLFPWVCHVHYPRIAPIIKDVCKEFDVRYVIYPTFLSAVQAHFKHLKRVGMGSKMH